MITKDEDFFKTYLQKREPYKLIYLTVGNIKNKQLLDLFRTNFDSWKFQLKVGANVIEINQLSVIIHD